jgi:catechol 2,3-dioxygenase-like lactoylglutathione lyase family enzyme
MQFSAGFAELVLIVRDVEEAARFYREVVGLIPERESSDSWGWFWLGDPGVEQRLAVHKGPLLFEEHSPRLEGERFGQVHFALTVPADRVEAALDRVRTSGVQVYGPKRFHQIGVTSHYFYDPDGNLVEFWTPDAPAEDS